MFRIPPVILVIIGLASQLAGCASMDRDECRSADWRAVGFEDGSRGLHPSRIGEYRRDCAEHGVRPAIDAYRAGHRDGARQFCKPHTGYRLGVRGAAYQDICPADLEEAFLAAYDYGRDIHRLQRELNAAQQRVDVAAQELHDLEHTLAHKESLLVDKHTPQVDRLLLLRDIKSLSEQKHHLESELYALREQSNAIAQEINDRKQRSPY